ncbi:MAG: hypothetical protein HY042_12210 [Spirochaetia bacterium]|nr:hypothetical protein [Spirochaetia bacterium]
MESTDRTEKQDQADRLIEERVQKAFREVASSRHLAPRTSDAQFKKSLSDRLSKLNSSKDMGKVLPFRWRAEEAWNRTREAVTGESGGIYRYASAAIFAFAIGVPLIMRTSKSENVDREEGLSVSHGSASLQSEVSKPSVNPGTVSSKSVPAHQDTPWRAVPPGQVSPTLPNQEAKEKVSTPASDFDLREKELLRNLEKAAGKQEKLAALRSLESFYKANGAQDRMRATQLRMDELKAAK